MNHQKNESHTETSIKETNHCEKKKKNVGNIRDKKKNKNIRIKFYLWNKEHPTHMKIK